jgi:hypothetical protein
MALSAPIGLDVGALPRPLRTTSPPLFSDSNPAMMGCEHFLLTWAEPVMLAGTRFCEQGDYVVLGVD